MKTQKIKIDHMKKTLRSRIIKGIFPYSSGIAQSTQTVRLMFSNVAYRATIYKTGVS